MNEGLTAEAERYYREAMKLQREMGAWAPYAFNMCQGAAMPLWKRGDLVTDRALLDEALAIAEEQKVDYVTAHVLAEMTPYLLVEERYHEAVAMTSEVQALTASHTSTAAWSRFERGIAFLGLGDLEEAINCMTASLARMADEAWSGFLRFFLPYPGIVLAELGEYEWAAELLALGLTDPYTPGRLQADPLISRMRTELKERLDEEAFAAAWERGRQLDVLEAADDVLERLS